jgi:aldehyde dehydrogenase (NAD+)
MEFSDRDPGVEIAPALAYGNTVVFKPADLVPGCAWALSRDPGEGRHSAGVFNLVMGRGSVVGEALVNDPDVAAISFTGPSAPAAPSPRRRSRAWRRSSSRWAARIRSSCSTTPTSDRRQLRDPGRVLLDRPALHGVVAPHRHGGIHDRFVAAMTEKLKRSRSTMRWPRARTSGPSSTEPARAGPALSRDRQGEGATLAIGGERLKRATDGYLPVAGALHRSHQRDAHRARGDLRPVACVIRAKDYDEALALANDTEFGLVRGHRHDVAQARVALQAHAQAGW